MTVRLLLLTVAIAAMQASGNDGVDKLTAACRVGNLQLAQDLLSSGMNPDLTDEYGLTALYYAASFNEAKLVELLLEYHANPNLPDVKSRRGDGQIPGTPLQYASSLGNLAIVRALVESGADVNTATTGGRTALHFAVAGIHLDVSEFLIENGAAVNARDADGSSPLDDAAWRGSLDEVAILLAHGAGLNVVETKTGATPINEAAYKGNASLIRYLLQFGPNVGVPDKRGITPLENAARQGKEDSALLLVEPESKDLQATEVFLRVIDAAIGKDESFLVDALLQHGVPPNGTSPSGTTLLDAAAFFGAAKTVKVLLREHADPNLPSHNGSTPLEDASLKGFAAIAGMLIDGGATVNHANADSGTSALYIASSFGRREVIALLLNHGADVSICGKNGKSAYQVALENGYVEIATQIKLHGGTNGCGHGK